MSRLINSENGCWLQPLKPSDHTKSCLNLSLYDTGSSLTACLTSFKKSFKMLTHNDNSVAAFDQLQTSLALKEAKLYLF